MLIVARNGRCTKARISDCSTILHVLLHLLRARVSAITPIDGGERFAGTLAPLDEVRDGDRKALAKNWLTRRRV